MGKRKIITRLSEYHLASMILIIIYTFLSCFFLPQCSAGDTITELKPLRDKETLVSAGERFELGFFSPSQDSLSIHRYVGIWYHNSNPPIYVWVANRDRAIPDQSGVLAIADGDLKLSDKNETVYFRTEVGNSISPVAKLMDNGNLVLIRDNKPATSYLWESFKNPTDTFLPGMKMDENLVLTSWKSQQDPSKGNFTFKRDQDENHFQIVNHYFSRYWRNAESNELSSQMVNLLSNLTVSENSSTPRTSSSGAINYSTLRKPTVNYSSTRLIMSFNGEIQFWRETNVTNWSLLWSEPRDNCSVFRYCGNFAICNSKSKPNCKCLKGFEPVSEENWKSGEFSDGCARKSVSCGENYTVLRHMKVSTRDLQHIKNLNETECSEECRKSSCQCRAYSFEQSNGRGDPSSPGNCWIWTKELYDLRENFANGGLNLFVLVAASDLDNNNSLAGSLTMQNETLNGRETQWALIVGLTTTSLFILSCIVIYFYNRRKRITNQEDTTILRTNMVVHFYDSEEHVKDMVDSGQFEEEDKKGIDLPFFDFERIIVATDNFSEANKLGKGGFGPVYKGKFPGGQEIAVKRLSSVSGQGLIEFKNEVILIARLQHRNLVRLVGYCIHGIEKILLYEYMPNKSLDIFIFDGTLSGLLDWEMRFNIILGIARGLLYLHQDSRLRIIHRDLKTSNILLDKEMNPKISDFGLARIFEDRNTEGTTNRVVGSYGYMSPEYALNGFFSVKSDVFSFGVVVLEIISGKRNTGFYNSGKALSLLGYAWKLWQEEKVLDLMDQQLNATSK